MCDSCPIHIPGPGEVAGGVIGAGVGAAMSKPGRKVLFWGLCIPALPFALWNELHLLVLVPVALLAVVVLGTHRVVRVLHRSGTVVARPELTHEMRAKLAARGLKPIPAPGQQARPALPRAMRRQLADRGRLTATVTGVRPTRPTRALPVAETVVTGRVVGRP